jgi:SAM-dependent methyltransferase
MSNAIRAFEHAGWQQAAETYAGAFATATRQFIPDILAAAEVTEGQAVLDVACGLGFLTQAANDAGARATGLDFSGAMLSVAARLHPTPRFDQGDAEALPYVDQSFDTVISSFGIHHAPNPVNALKEAHRVLRPGGRLAFATWTEPANNIAWKLVFDAVSARGDLAASQAPPPGGGLASQTACLDALTQGNFRQGRVVRIGKTWRHQNGAALLQALKAGTARMAALIGAQTPDALIRIADAIDEAATSYRDAAGLAIPIAAYLATGRKPA